MGGCGCGCVSAGACVCACMCVCVGGHGVSRSEGECVGVAREEREEERRVCTQGEECDMVKEESPSSLPPPQEWGERWPEVSE